MFSVPATTRAPLSPFVELGMGSLIAEPSDGWGRELRTGGLFNKLGTTLSPGASLS